jgi:telomerase reverse transcriptase
MAFLRLKRHTLFGLHPRVHADHLQIVDFVLWKLFRTSTGPFAPSHMLCRGYQKYMSNVATDEELSSVAGVPGVFRNTTNPYVERLKKLPWSALPSIVGVGAERVLADLFLHCGVFEPIKNNGNLNQISGTPLSDLKQVIKFNIAAVVDDEDVEPRAVAPTCAAAPCRGRAEIRFVRYRMLHAGPNLTAKGNIRFGLSQHHVLNRIVETGGCLLEEHILRYIFPREFGLHNVFTSATDRRDTSQPFKDYSDREQEIAHSICEWRRKRRKVKDTPNDARPPLPKRLRGDISQIVKRIFRRHTRCAYSTLLDRYCPNRLAEAGDAENTIKQASLPSQVSAFCRAVVSKVLPGELWGESDVRSHNRRCIMRNIDRFVRLGRYETISLHDIVQDIKLQDIAWLIPPHGKTGQSMSASDFAKRKDLMAEFLYFFVDSFLIPLIRGHFHVTESGAHRNQLFYFRHDVWKTLSEPAFSSLKADMLEPCHGGHIKATLSRRALGVSTIRLLPKDKGMRPIINSRRKVPRMQNGQLVLGKSINNILTPAFSVLNYEKSANKDLLASAMFSVEDVYPRLQEYRQRLEAVALFGKPLYFAKVDVKACFDTIPQQRLMQLARDILTSEAYRVTRYARGKLVGRSERAKSDFGTKPSWRYLTKGTAATKAFEFSSELGEDAADGRTRTVYIDGVVQKTDKRQAILRLLGEHIESNLIRLGNKLYRQKQGIPQGSIVSSLLCSYFYADMERKVLDFVHDDGGVLLRLIDDFLIITTERDVAERFLQVMHRGIPEYGVEVKAEKSRANFDIEVNGVAIPRLPEVTDFPYCGNAINTVTLDLSKDRERRKKSSTSESHQAK